MLYIAFGILVISMFFMLTPIYEEYIDFKDFNVPYVFGIVVLFLVIVLFGGTLTYETMPQKIKDFDTCGKTEVYEIKDFMCTEINQGGYKDPKKIYSYKLNDSVKKEVKADSDTMVVLSKSSDKEEYTKVTIKEKESFNWVFFTTDTYKQYVFS